MVQQDYKREVLGSLLQQGFELSDQQEGQFLFSRRE